MDWENPINLSLIGCCSIDLEMLVESGTAGPHLQIDFPVALENIPTLSQWGLILLSLLLLTLGSVSIIRQRETAFAAVNANATSLHRPTPLFNADLFQKIALKSIPFMIAAIAVISIAEGGLFVRNILGTMASGFILAYLVHFMMMSRPSNNEQSHEKK